MLRADDNVRKDTAYETVRLLKLAAAASKSLKR